MLSRGGPVALEYQYGLGPRKMSVHYSGQSLAQLAVTGPRPRLIQPALQLLQALLSGRHCWEYRYDTVINALLENGFRIDSLNERDELFFTPWPEFFEPSGPNYWRLKEGQVPIPLSFTLKATRQ